MRVFSILFLISAVSFCLVSMQKNINSWQIDDKYSIYPQLPGTHVHYGIERGRILLETQWINHYHNFGNYFPVHTQDSQERTIISIDKVKSYPLLTLTHLLFYRVPHSQSDADFTITQHIKQKDPLILAKICATTLLNAEQLKLSVNKFMNIKDALEGALKILLSESSSSTTQRKILEDLNTVLQQSKYNAFNNLGVMILSDKNKLFSTDEFLTLKQLLSDFRNNFKFIEAYKECYKGLFDPAIQINMLDFTLLLGKVLNDPYPFNTAQEALGVIIAFFYRTIINNCDNNDMINQSIAAYYDELALHVNGITPSEQNLHNLSHTQAEKLFLDTINIYDYADSALLYLYIKSCLFATLEPYKKVSYKSPDGKQYVFSDCVENTIANFVRILSYDVEKRIYSIGTLQDNLQKKLSSKSYDLLEKFLNNPFDHNYWASLIENLDYVPYARSSEQQQDDDDTQEYIEQSEGYAFELRSSLRSLIMIFNYIFDLDVVELDDVERSDFVGHYFPKIVEALNMKLDYQDNNGNVIQNIDEVEDDASTNVIIRNKFNEQNTLKNFEGVHTFHMMQHHAEYFFSTELIDEQEQNTEHTLLSSNIEAESSSDIYKNILLDSYISKTYSTPINYSNLNNVALMFSIALNNPDYMYSMIHRGLLPLICNNENNQYLIANIILNEPDIDRRGDLIEVFQIHDSSFSIDDERFQEVFENDQVLQEDDEDFEQVTTSSLRRNSA